MLWIEGNVPLDGLFGYRQTWKARRGPLTGADGHSAGTEITPSMIPSVSQHAGQQLLTGAQAEVYANDFIAVHLSELPDGGV